MSALDNRQGQSQRQSTRAAGGGGGGGSNKKKKPNRRGHERPADHGGGGNHRGGHGGGGGGGGKKDVTKTPDEANVPKLPFAAGGKPLGLNVPITGAIGSSFMAPGYSSLPAYSAPLAAPAPVTGGASGGAHVATPIRPQPTPQTRGSVLNTAGQSSNPFSLQAAANSAGGMSAPDRSFMTPPAPAAPKMAAPVRDPYAKIATPKTNPVTGNTPLAEAATSANPLAGVMKDLSATRSATAPAGTGRTAGLPPMQRMPGQRGQGTPQPGGGGNPYGGGAGPIFSDKNDYEYEQFTQKPEESYTGFLQTAGLTSGGNDAMGKWLADQYKQMQMQYQALKTDYGNQNLSWFDFLGNLGGTPYGQPGWDQAFNRYMTGRYRNDTLANRGLNYSPYEGQSRWLAIG